MTMLAADVGGSCKTSVCSSVQFYSPISWLTLLVQTLIADS